MQTSLILLDIHEMSLKYGYPNALDSKVQGHHLLGRVCRVINCPDDDPKCALPQHRQLHHEHKARVRQGTVLFRLMAHQILVLLVKSK